MSILAILKLSIEQEEERHGAVQAAFIPHLQPYEVNSKIRLVRHFSDLSYIRKNQIINGRQSFQKPVLLSTLRPKTTSSLLAFAKTRNFSDVLQMQSIITSNFAWNFDTRHNGAVLAEFLDSSAYNSWIACAILLIIPGFPVRNHQQISSNWPEFGLLRGNPFIKRFNVLSFHIRTTRRYQEHPS